MKQECYEWLEERAEEGMLLIGTAFIIIAIVMLMCSQAHAQQSIRWFKDNNGVYYANTYSTNAPATPWPLYPIWESSTMTAQSLPLPYTVTASGVTAGGYEGWNAFDNDTTTRWQSDASAFPHFVKYDCGAGNSKTVVSLVMRFYAGYNANAFTLQGSPDDSAWTTLITGNAINNADLDQLFTVLAPSAYRYYKINATSGTDTQYLLMTEAHLSSGSYFPPLASDVLPSPYAAWATSTNQIPITPAFFAFDCNHNATSAWASASGRVMPQTLTFDAGSSVKCNGFLLWSILNYGMNAYSFDASLDLSAWTTLQSGNAANTDSKTFQTFTNSNTTAYRYYRWVISSSYSSGVQVNEIRLLKYQ